MAKKSKKKKNNNANKPTQDVSGDENQWILEPQSDVPKAVRHKGIQVSLDADRGGRLPDNFLSKGEENFWLDWMANFQEKLKEITSEKDKLEQKETVLKKKINQLSKEKGEFSQKEAFLTQNIAQLTNENDALLRREDDLEEEIQSLNKDISAFRQTENTAREIIMNLDDLGRRLQAEVHELVKSRDGLIEERKQFMGVISNLEEHIKALGGSLNTHNTSVQEQRDELVFTSGVEVAHHPTDLAEPPVERSGDGLIEEKEQLVDIISNSEEQIKVVGGFLDTQNTSSQEQRDEFVFPSGVEDVNHSIDPAKPLVADPITENNELTDEANESYDEVEQWHEATAEQSVLDPLILLHDIAVRVDNMSERDGTKHRKLGRPSAGNEEERKQGQGEKVNVTKAPVPVSLCDAPFIGAPFRLIRLIWRYVIGADLVDKSS